MKRLRLLAMAVLPLLLAVSLLMGCSKGDEPAERTPEGKEVTAQGIKERAAEAFETTRSYTQQQKEEYERKIETELDKLDERIKELKSEASEAGEEAQKAINEAIKDVESREKAVDKKLEELKSAGDDAWESLKSEVDEALHELKRAYKRAVSYFENQ